MADRPTTPRLDVLIDRACRHLTPDEGTALRAGWHALRERLRKAERGVNVLADAHRRAERAEQQAAAVRGTLAEVLAQFTHNTHPGRPCKQTGHVSVATIERWRAALAPSSHCGNRATHSAHPWLDYAQPRHCPGHDAALDTAGQPAADEAREDGQNAACGATEATGDPEPAETPTGRHAPAQRP